MADIQAFRGFRYDLGRVGTLSDVVAPPYDVISPTLQQQLYDRSEYNAIRLELTRDEPTDTEHDNKYTRAARTIRDWVNTGILVQDSARSLYVYEQRFEVEGKVHERRGFFARVRLEPFGTGRIYPHEQTMSGPKADRLKLFQATGMNLSPIFGLYPDDEFAVFAELEPTLLRTLPIEATDHLGVTSRLWPISDSGIISRVAGLMGPKPIFIADGHHRYETGLKYLEDRKAIGDVANDETAPNFTMMMLVSMSDPGLLILPTHRLIGGLPRLTFDDVSALLAPHFEVEKVGSGTDAMRETWDRIELDGSQSMLGFGTVVDGAWCTARFRDPTVMERLVPDHTPAWRELGVSILHVLVLDRLIAEKYGNKGNCTFVHLLREVEEWAGSGEGQLAALVPPASMSHVENIAGNLEKMPPKSTYFHPKLLTGMVFNSLKTN